MPHNKDLARQMVFGRFPCDIVSDGASRELLGIIFDEAYDHGRSDGMRARMEHYEMIERIQKLEIKFRILDNAIAGVVAETNSLRKMITELKPVPPPGEWPR